MAGRFHTSYLDSQRHVIVASMQDLALAEVTRFFGFLNFLHQFFDIFGCGHSPFSLVIVRFFSQWSYSPSVRLLVGKDAPRLCSYHWEKLPS